MSDRSSPIDFPQVLLAHRIPKPGSTEEECQDAYYFQNERYALADGVGRSFFPAEWADLLVRHFCQGNDNETLWAYDWQKWLAPLQTQWLQLVKAKVALRSSYSERNSLLEKKPAGATFTGLEFIGGGEPWRWRAILIGDSCLFHARGDELLASYPLAKSEQFTQSTEHFPSNWENRKGGTAPSYLEERLAEDGDVFILASDALAQWLLVQKEQDGWAHAWNDLAPALYDPEKFGAWVKQKRETHARPLQDDVSIIVVALGSIVPPVPIGQLAPYDVVAPQLAATPLGTTDKVGVARQSDWQGDPRPTGVSLLPEAQSRTRKLSNPILLLVMFLLISVGLNLWQFYTPTTSGESAFTGGSQATPTPPGEAVLASGTQPTLTPTATTETELAAPTTASPVERTVRAAVSATALPESPVPPTAMPSPSASPSPELVVPTPTYTASPLPEASPSTTVMLMSGQFVRVKPDTMAAPVLELRGPATVSATIKAIVEVAGVSWYEVEVELWSVQKAGRAYYTERQRQVVHVIAATYALTEPTFDESRQVGLAWSPYYHPWLDTQTVQGATWHKYRLVGFVPAGG